MSLVEEIKELLLAEDGVGVYDVTFVLHGVNLESDEIVDTGRWYIYHDAVFSRYSEQTTDYEYVGVSYSTPATEMQEDSGEPVEVYAVEPYEETVTKYRKV